MPDLQSLAMRVPFEPTSAPADTPYPSRPSCAIPGDGTPASDPIARARTAILDAGVAALLKTPPFVIDDHTRIAVCLIGEEESAEKTMTLGDFVAEQTFPADVELELRVDLIEHGVALTGGVGPYFSVHVMSEGRNA